MENGRPLRPQQRHVETHGLKLNRGEVKWLSIIQHGFRDAALLPFGAWIIWKQVYAPNPSWFLALIGFACMVPSARFAVASILSGLASFSDSHPQPPGLSSGSSSHEEGANGKHN